MASEQEDFLKDLDIKTDDSIFEQPLSEAPAEESATKEADDTQEQEPKNRREKRLMQRLQSHREENIALSERIKAISEAQKLRQETTESDFLKTIDGIYGNDTPEKREATELLKKGIKGAYENAKHDAIEEFEARETERRDSEAKAITQEEDNLDEMLDGLEDDHGADFSNEAVKQGFLTLLEKLSPKDRSGNIIEFADPVTTWEIYNSRTDKTASRAKELASRSMARSGNSQPSKLESDATERYLRENDLI